MSSGDLVSVGGPGSCPWDGTDSVTQHSTPSFPKSSLEERFAADLNADSTAQHDEAAELTSVETSAQHGQMAVSQEQACQTDTSAEQSMQSRHSATSNGSMHSTGQKPNRGLTSLDELAGLLLPQSCRVAARVSTKLPPLDHNPTLPPLPEGFILPPEMHPVVGSYWTCKPAMASTGSQTAAAKAPASAASPRDTAVSTEAGIAASSPGEAGGKWVHPKQAPPAHQARYVAMLTQTELDMAIYS